MFAELPKQKQVLNTFARGRAYYERGDANSGSLRPFAKETGFGWVNPITYWVDKIKGTTTPEPTAQVNIQPLSMATSHDTVLANTNPASVIGVPSPTAAQVVNEMSTGGSTSLGVTGTQSEILAYEKKSNTGLFIIGGLIAAVIGINLLMKSKTDTETGS